MAVLVPPFGTCVHLQVLIRELLAETDEACEYAIYVLGLIARQEGNVTFSLELFQKAMQLNPNSAENKKQLARSLFLLGKHKAALEAYTDTLTLSPNDWVGGCGVGLMVRLELLCGWSVVKSSNVGLAMYCMQLLLATDILCVRHGIFCLWLAQLSNLAEMVSLC